VYRDVVLASSCDALFVYNDAPTHPPFYIRSHYLATMVRSNHVCVGYRVEGCHGPLVQNPNPSIKRRVRSKVVGTVMRAAELHKWEVVFDYDGKAKVVRSSSLKVVEEGTGVPLDELSTNIMDSAVVVSPAAVSRSASSAASSERTESVSLLLLLCNCFFLLFRVLTTYLSKISPGGYNRDCDRRYCDRRSCCVRCS
jgi:hypothetical protein